MCGTEVSIHVALALFPGQICKKKHERRLLPVLLLGNGCLGALASTRGPEEDRVLLGLVLAVHATTQLLEQVCGGNSGKLGGHFVLVVTKSNLTTNIRCADLEARVMCARPHLLRVVGPAQRV